MTRDELAIGAARRAFLLFCAAVSLQKKSDYDLVQLWTNMRNAASFLLCTVPESDMPEETDQIILIARQCVQMDDPIIKKMTGRDCRRALMTILSDYHIQKEITKL